MVKKGPINSGRGLPLPPFRAMLERKHFFCGRSSLTALNVPTSLDWSGAKPRKRAIKPSDSSRYVASLEEPLLVEGRRAPRSLESQQSLGQQLAAARQATTTYYQPPLPSKRQHTHSTMLATCSAGKGRALTQHGFYRQFQEIQNYIELSEHIYKLETTRTCD